MIARGICTIRKESVSNLIGPCIVEVTTNIKIDNVIKPFVYDEKVMKVSTTRT
jgi:hypothetical protein